MGSHRFMNYERAKMLENSIFILQSKCMSLLRPAKFELYNGLFQCWAQNLEKSPVPFFQNFKWYNHPSPTCTLTPLPPSLSDLVSASVT